MNKFAKGWKYYRLKDHSLRNIWFTGGIIFQVK